MFYDNAEGMVFRPPSEANSLILRVTIGCAHNRCTFCSMYRDVQFRARPQEEVFALIEQAALYYPETRRVFLADGDALVLSSDRLLAILEKLKRSFPKLSRVTCYGGPKDICRKTPGELKALHNAGLAIIYLGIESGDDQILANIDKGATAEEMITAGRRVIDSGIKLSAMLILGLGGKTLTHQHAVNSAKVISAVNPTMLSCLTLMLHSGTPLRAAADRGEFLPLNPYEIMLELEEFLEQTELTAPCIFRSNHASNLLPLAGTLPKDKSALLNDVRSLADYLKERCRQEPFYNDTGDF